MFVVAVRELRVARRNTVRWKPTGVTVLCTTMVNATRCICVKTVFFRRWQIEGKIIVCKTCSQRTINLQILTPLGELKKIRDLSKKYYKDGRGGILLIPVNVNKVINSTD